MVDHRVMWHRDASATKHAFGSDKVSAATMFVPEINTECETIDHLGHEIGSSAVDVSERLDRPLTSVIILVLSYSVIGLSEDKKMSISVIFPEELLVASREDRDQFTRQVMIYTLGHLYEQGKISSGLGARVLACDRRGFYRVLTECGWVVRWLGLSLSSGLAVGCSR